MKVNLDTITGLAKGVVGFGAIAGTEHLVVLARKSAIPFQIVSNTASVYSANSLLGTVFIFPVVEELVKSKLGVIGTIAFSLLETAYVSNNLEEVLTRLLLLTPFHVCTQIIGRKRGLGVATLIHICWNFMSGCSNWPTWAFYISCISIIAYAVYLTKERSHG